MMSSDAKHFVLPLILVIAGFGVILGITPRVEGLRPALPQGFSDSDLVLQGKDLRGYLLGAEGLVADWYWIISLQYLGGKIVDQSNADINLNDLTGLNPRLLYPYLDNATSLDPKFMSAYSFGATVLPAIDPTRAIELTERGIRNNPEHWRLYQYLGYIHWQRKDYQAAALTYEAGSKIPGAPPFMRQMVASMRSKGGDRETARLIYQQMLEQAEDEQSKRNAQFRLNEINALDEIDAVNRVLSEFASSPRGCPSALRDIFPRLQTLELPSGAAFRIGSANELVDPSGTPYVFDRAKCEIALDQAKSGIPALK